MSQPLLVRGAEVRGHVVDVRTDGAHITQLGIGLRPRLGERVVEAGGGALLPGLHDHHVHLLSWAAAATSIDVAPPSVRSGTELRAVLRAAHAALPPGAWLRGTGLDEGVTGPVDRGVLDAATPGRPVRLQDRSGTRWVLSSRAVELLGVEELPLPGVERDAVGRATGRLQHLDAWLRRHALGGPPDLAALGPKLLAAGVTGATDATPTDDAGDVALLADAVADGSLPVDLRIMGGASLPDDAAPGLRRGPVKLYLAEDDLPTLPDLVSAVSAAHGRRRPVAFHCVSAIAAILAVTALDDAGPLPGDRIEHGAIVPVELVPRLAALGATVVTQPSFVADRGDRYVAEGLVDADGSVYPCASLLAGGVRVAFGTDAPFGDPDPWRTIRAAVSRTTSGGQVLGSGERLPARAALALFLAPLEDPGGPPRRVVVGARSDLCLLDVPLAEALRAPSIDVVRATFPAARAGDGGGQAAGS